MYSFVLPADLYCELQYHVLLRRDAEGALMSPIFDRDETAVGFPWAREL
jgi:hypothetical protein